MSRIVVNEYPNPMCEISDTDVDVHIVIRTLEEAELIVSSLSEMIRIIKERQMKLKHKTDDYVIVIEAKNGEPVLNRKGFVNVLGGVSYGWRAISLDVIDDKFEVVA